MTERRLDVVYCEGWAPDTRTLVGRLDIATARDRHTRGGQFAVALTRGWPRVVLEIAWGRRFARSWQLEEHGRRVRRLDYRVLADGRLFLIADEEWGYLTPDVPEFDTMHSLHVERSYRLDGRCRDAFHPNGHAGGGRTRFPTVPVEELTQPVPQFGDWLPLTGLDPVTQLHATADPTVVETTPAPWRPPEPLHPFALAETFTPGSRFALQGGTVVVETRPAGTLRLTSGRLVAGDAGMLSDDMEPFTTTVPPGTYPVELALARSTDAPDNVRVTAAKLTIAPEPIVSWTPALTPGRDPILLDDDGFYGFGVDSGMACFVDADALAAFDSMVGAAPDLFEDNTFIDIREPTSGANMIAFRSGPGDGAYPTWQGHTADGTVAAFVIDLLVLHGSELLPDER